MAAVMSERPPILRLQKRKSRKKPEQSILIERPYLDRGRPGVLRYNGDDRLPLVKDPPPVERVMLSLQALRRHNTLQPELQPTDRLLLRWGEGLGTGLPNPNAETRQTHYDPLPPNVQELVDDIVSDSPWRMLTRWWYRTTLTSQEMAESLQVSRAQLYIDWRSALWYYRGRFESQQLVE